MSLIFDLLRLVYDALLLVHIDVRILITLPHRRLHPLANHFIVRTHRLAGLQIDQYFSTHFSYPSWMILPFSSSGDTNYYNKTLEEMEKIWTFTSGGSLLLISYVYIASCGVYSSWICRLSVALFQIDAVCTTLWGKTLAITTFTLALATMLSSSILLVDKASLSKVSVILRWQEVRSPKLS